MHKALLALVYIAIAAGMICAYMNDMWICFWLGAILLVVLSIVSLMISAFCNIMEKMFEDATAETSDGGAES